MIYSTTNQFFCFLIFLFFGIIFGFIFSFLSIIFLKNYLKKIKKSIFDLVFYSIFCIFFVIFVIFFNYGQFSFSLILSYILGFVWIINLNKKTIAFLEIKWYNILNQKDSYATKSKEG